MILLAACGSGPGTDPVPRPSRATLEQVLAGLSPRDQVAQLIMPFTPGSYSGYDAEALDRLRFWVDELHVGGIIASIGSPLDIAARLNHLQSLSTLPLLVAGDLEGGSASRFTGGTAFPTNMGVAATGRPEDARAMGRITAREARAVGIHMAFAPVADVNSNPANPIINTRSFGSDPTRVGRLVAETVRGMEENGLFATVKHFPGHGDTDTDSHLGLPEVNAPWSRLSRVELPPFEAAIQAGVTGVMSGHIALPALDPERRPATLVPGILTGILRDSLGFGGVIVTDALDMGALQGPRSPGEVAIQAFLAGADILLMPTDPAVVIDAMVDAVEKGRIPHRRLEASVRRILALKQRAGLFRTRTVSLDAIPEVVGSRDHLAVADSVAGRSLVLLRNRDGVLDEMRSPTGDVAIIAWSDGPEATTLGTTLHRALAERSVPLRPVTRLSPTSTPQEWAAAEATAGIATHTIWLVASRRGAAPTDSTLPEPLRRHLHQSGVTPLSWLLVVMGSPYVLGRAFGFRGVMLAWAPTPVQERAVARVLEGAPVTGRSPVTIPGMATVGLGLDLPAHSWAPLDALVDSAIASGVAPGAVLGVSVHGNRHIHGAGRLGLGMSQRPDGNTVYDLASLTKVVALTTAALFQVHQGRLLLGAPVQQYLPEFTGPGKDQVLVRHLFTHESGLPAGRPLYRETTSRDSALALVNRTPLDTTPGTRFRYSDLGAIVATQVVERVGGAPLPELLRHGVFQWLQMTSTSWNPPAEWRSRIAPTEDDPWRGRIIHGEVHDENAARLEGVSGHAGLFSSTNDLLTFGEWLLRGFRSLEYPDCLPSRLSCGAPPPPPLVHMFWQRQGTAPGSSRAFGWDTPTGTNSAGTLMSDIAFGHTGFTGTSLWIDPGLGLVLVLLTNRVHPSRSGTGIAALRRAVADRAVLLIQTYGLAPRPDPLLRGR